MAQNDKVTLYRDCTPVVTTWHDSTGAETVADTLLDSLAEAADVDITALPPLYGTIDLDALTRLFASHERTENTNAAVGFEFETWNVYVRADGCIRICDQSQPTAPAPAFEDVSA